MKKGSALLIVLGMVAFMVVSAVGFSIYMRTSRAPSGYLRRNVAARYLVKAALAKAIGELEGDFNADGNWGGTQDAPKKLYGIYDDPYPGIVIDDPSAHTDFNGRKDGSNGDYWLGRVFMPFGPLSDSESDWEKTISTLTLEALAYLPPALIDDVRRLSRYTRTAIWRSLPYDAGRYAYCAVNVSDLFDINKLRANVARDSGLNRVTLAALCNDDNGSLDVGTATALDTILDMVESRTLNGSVVPFVSLADFNLAGAGSEWAPFMSAVGKTGGAGDILEDGVVENALFITDTWFPTAATNNVGQPFASFSANNIDDVRGLVETTVWEKQLGIGAACLYDYLDPDSVPVSLAFPSVEAIPMIAGIGAPQMKPAVVQADTEITDYPISKTVGEGEEQRTITIKRTCKRSNLVFDGGFTLSAVAAYPFKRMGNRTRSFSYRAIMKVFLADPDSLTECRYSNGNFRPGKGLWEDGSYNADCEDGIVILRSESTSPQFGGNIAKTADWENAVKPVLFNFDEPSEMPMFVTVVDTCDDEEYGAQYTGTKITLDGIEQNGKALRPLDVSGLKPKDNSAWFGGFAANRDFKTANLADIKEFSDSGEYALCASVWIQVLDGGNVVDMVPAYVEDDVDWRGLSPRGLIERALGDDMPLMFFKTATAKKKFTELQYDGSAISDYLGWGVLYAVDPRFNFAPEDWFSQSDFGVSAGKWKELIGIDGGSSPIFGQGGHDRDMFMFVSDRGKLQSVGELQFLPYLQDMNANGGTGFFWGGDYCSANYGGEPFSDRTGPTSGRFANGDYFWRTYCAYDNGQDNNDFKYGNPYVIPFDSEPGGFRLNPFSDDARVFKAAVAGTPLDYYAAFPTEEDRTFDKNSVFGGVAGEFLDPSTVESGGDGNKASVDTIADMIVDRIWNHLDASMSNDGWKEAWSGRDRNDNKIADNERLVWQENDGGMINDANSKFLDLDVDSSTPLHGVDRKYLYSFWRDCFDNRQQLFLIFVRAEPAPAGGGGAGKMPSQMGGRAVALVWRDPEPPEGSGTRPKRSEFTDISTFLQNRGNQNIPPHRTRVLFYHQFD